MIHSQEEKTRDLNDFKVEIEPLRTWLEHLEKSKSIGLLVYSGMLFNFCSLNALESLLQCHGLWT